MAGRARLFGLLALGLVLLGVGLAVPRIPEPIPPAVPPDASVSAPSASAAPSSVPTLEPVDDSIDDYDVNALTIPEQREALAKKMGRVLSLDERALAKVRAMFASSDWMSQGNP
ncbi:MAG TPA: hypothetical protein VF103_12475, partial [Polyangiaceae bacterium]